jgi:hypothetical protein
VPDRFARPTAKELRSSRLLSLARWDAEATLNPSHGLIRRVKFNLEHGATAKECADVLGCSVERIEEISRMEAD